MSDSEMMQRREEWLDKSWELMSRCLNRIVIYLLALPLLGLAIECFYV